MSTIPPACLQFWHAHWTALCSEQIYNKDHISDLLPDPKVDLTVFADTQLPLVHKTSRMGRHPDIRTKLLFLTWEASEKSQLSYLLICTIVCLRRDPKNADARALFHRIIDEHTGQVCSELNLRWLVSICDTLVDCGATPAQVAIGFAASALVNTVKLYETELRVYNPARPWPPAKRFAHGGDMFDGIQAFSAPKGDMIDNLLERAFTAAEADNVAGAILLEMLARLQYHNTVFARIGQIAGNDPIDVFDAETIQEIKQYLVDRGL